MKNFTQSLVGLWKHLGINQRVSLIVAALAVVGGLVAIVLWSGRPDYQLLYARLGEKDAAAVISYLQSQNVPHQITAGGSAVQVPSKMVHKLRMDLAGKGIPSGEGVGFEIFDKGQFGLSDFVQRTNYLRALQGELSRTIIQLDGVRSARVMIVQPENRLLLTGEGVKSTASVFVDLGGGRMEADQVNAIRHLVANAVQGLAPDQVAVIDNRGRTLSEELRHDPTLGSASSQIRYRQQVEDYFAKKVESMLATVVGPGNAVVRVSADIEVEATTQMSEKYDPEGQIVRSQTTTDDLTNTTESRPGGAAGVSANVPDKPATVDGRPTSISEQNRKNRTTTYEINKTIINTTRSPGTIRSISAAVFLSPRPAVPTAAAAPAGANAAPAPSPKRSQQELETIRQLVMNTLGVRVPAGQPIESIVSIHETEFEVPAPFAAAQLEAARTSDSPVQIAIDTARTWAPVAGAVVALLIFWRMLNRQKPEPVPIEVLSLSPGEAGSRRLQDSGQVTAEMLNELIRKKPAHVGVALRGWSAGTPSAKS